MYKKVFYLLFLFLFLNTSLVARSEDYVKGMYVGRFSMFFKWPEKIETLNVCIYNDNKFTNSFKKDFKAMMFNNKPFNVLSFRKGSLNESIGKCHILYARNISVKKNKKTIHKFTNNVLLISDNYDDIHEGAIVSFFLKDNKIKFVINQQALVNSGLDVSYKLLKYAKVVNRVGR